jgi:hypothetical protein
MENQDDFYQNPLRSKEGYGSTKSIRVTINLSYPIYLRNDYPPYICELQRNS